MQTTGVFSGSVAPNIPGSLDLHPGEVKTRDDVRSVTVTPQAPRSTPAVDHVVDIKVTSPDDKYQPSLQPVNPFPDEKHVPVESFLHHFNQIDPADQKDIVDQFRKFVDKSGERSTQFILLELEHILQKDVFQLKIRNLFDKGHISHAWVYLENLGANATNIPWIFFSWITSIVGFVAFVKIFNPNTTLQSSDLIAQLIGGILAIFNSFQWALLFSPKLEAMVTSFETYFGKARSKRLREWIALCRRNPKAGILQMIEYLVMQTIQIVSNLTGGIAVPLGIYAYLQNLPLNGAYFTTLLTYLGGWVFFRNYLGKDFAAFVKFILDFNLPFMLARLFSHKFFQAFNVLIEGLTPAILKPIIVYAYISNLAIQTFGWFPTDMVIACALTQQLVLYQKTYKNHIQYSIDLRKLLRQRKNIEVLAASNLLAPEQAALIAELRQFPRRMSKEESERYFKVVDRLTDSLELLLVKRAIEHLPIGYVWKKDWKVVITDIFASMVGGWVGSKISATLLSSMIGGPFALSIGVILGAAALGGFFHLAEATTCNDRLAYQYAVNFFNQKRQEKENAAEVSKEEAWHYFQQITAVKDEKQDRHNDEKLIPVDVNLGAASTTDLSWKTIGKIALVTVLVLSFTGSTLFSEMGMVNTQNAILMAGTAIAIMKLLISNQKYNGEMNYDRVNRLNWNFGLSCEKPSQVKATLYSQNKVVPVASAPAPTTQLAILLGKK